MNKKFFFTLILLSVIIGLTFIWTQYEKKFSFPHKQLSTYFTYTDNELSPVRSLKPKNTITEDDLRFWEDTAFELVGDHKTGSSGAAKFYVYLFAAQRDAAYLSFNHHGEFAGSIDPVSREVCCLFYEAECSRISQNTDSDPYSQALADLVMSKIKERIAKDKKTNRIYPRKEGDEYWIARGVAQGKNVGSWNTWLIQSGQQFRIPPPPEYGSYEDIQQLQLAKDVYKNLTDRQKRLIVTWAGGDGTKRLAGTWIKVASDYMRTKEVRLDQMLYIRSILAMGIVDGYITANDSKYTYWQQRPFMRDPSIQTYMPTPNHPSYPSSAATTAAFSSAMLSHYFPEEKSKWSSLKEEAGDTRVWSGIHFPADVEQGFAIGENVAKEIIDKFLDK